MSVKYFKYKINLVVLPLLKLTASMHSDAVICIVGKEKQFY